MLARSALRGVAWNWTGSAVLVVAQLASTAVTARLVSPAEFGFYAAAQAIYGFAGFFCMRAVGQELQRRAQLGPGTVGTAIAIAVAASLVVAAGIVLGAPLWADAWGVPEAAWAIRAFAVALLFQSAATVPLALLRRDLRFGRAAAIETGAIVAGMTAGVVLAVILHSALALALGQVAGTAALLLSAAGNAHYDLRPTFDRADARALAGFAGQVGGLGFLAYCTSMLPSLFVARQFGAAVLGLFSRARQMAELPADYAVSSVYRVIYPLYGRVRDDTARTRTLLREALGLSTGLAWPAFAFLAGAAPAVVAVVLGPRWQGAAPLLSLCALGVCAAIPTGLLTNCAEAFGWMRIIAFRQVALLAGVAAVLVVARVAHGSAGALLLGVAGVQWAVYVATLLPFVRRELLAPRELAAEHGLHAAVALFAFGLGVACAEAAGGASTAIRACVLLAGAILLCAVLILVHPVIPAGRILVRRLTQVAPRLAALPWVRTEDPSP